MLLKLTQRYPGVVADVSVEQFRREPGSYQLVGTLELTDGSSIHVKDYSFRGGARKYSYHWQSAEGQFIGRWDNAPHWPEVESHPHHFHDGSEEHVTDSNVRDVEDLLELLRDRLAGQ